MPNGWFFDVDHGSPFNCPLASNNFGGQLLSHFITFPENILHQLRHFPVPGTLALQESFNRFSRFAGALIFWLSSHSNFNAFGNLQQHAHGSKPGNCRASTPVGHKFSSIDSLMNIRFNFKMKGMFVTPELFSKVSKSAMRQLGNEAERLQLIPMLSLAAALVPPLNNISPGAVAGPLENANVKVRGCMDQLPCDVEHRDCGDLLFLDLKRPSRHTVEPRTGIEFPTTLGSILSEMRYSPLTSEVLVGTGSRLMTVIKIKSLKLYAFGFYVHPHSLCKNLGAKYASVPVGELSGCKDFFKDLLWEDISMTVRLVINVNGMKFNSVKDAFEKSLSSRLIKINPDTDYECLRAFGSYFKQDIPLPQGTTVDFRRTTDGQLITEIEGKQIGAVHSKELCRAFFDMYIGDSPVSEQTKEEIGRNAGRMMRGCGGDG